MRSFTALVFFYSLSLCAFGQIINDYQDFFSKTIKQPIPSTFAQYSSLGSVDIPTGRFGLEIPFYTIETPFLKLPIALTYQTSGVKLNDVASVIGINWNLKGGGSVRRILRGRPDDLATHVDADPQNDIYSGKRNNRGELSNITFTTFSPATTYPTSYGSGRVLMNNLFLTKFPSFSVNVAFFSPAVASNEIQALLLWRMMQAHRPTLDIERDIFRVSVGDKNFHFILKVRDQYKDIATTDVKYDMQTYFEAICLDKKGVKIEFTTQYVPYFKSWLNPLCEPCELEPESNRVRNNTMLVITGFTITDTDGIRYIFDKYEFQENEYVNDYMDHSFVATNNNRTIQYSLEDVVIAEWKISKIILPDLQEINFDYVASIAKFTNLVPRRHTGEYQGFGRNVQPEIFSNCIKNVDSRVEGYQLNEIKYSNKLSIKFFYDDNRPDLLFGGKSLRKIVLLDGGAREIRSFALEKHFTYSDSYGDSRDHRMFLTAIRDSREDYSTEFSYKEFDDLPPRARALNQDLFGFYCRNIGGSDLDPAFPKFYLVPNDESGNKIVYEPPTAEYHVEFQGLDRTPNALVVDYGTMNRVKFATGGSLEIEYEMNQYQNPHHLSGIGQGPGVRVRKLKYFDGENPEIPSLTKRYEYDSGVLLFKPSYAYISNLGYDNMVDRSAEQDEEYVANFEDLYYKASVRYEISKQTLQDKGVMGSGELLKKLTVVSTHALGPQTDIFGRDILYRRVREFLSSPVDDHVTSGFSEYSVYYEDNRLEVNVVSGPSEDQTYLPKGTIEDGFPFVEEGLSAQNRPWRGSTLLNAGHSGEWHVEVMYGLVEKRGFDIYPFPDRAYFSGKHLLNGTVVKETVFNSSGQLLSVKERQYSSFVNIQNSGTDSAYAGNYGLKNISTSHLPTHVYSTKDPSKSLDFGIVTGNGLDIYHNMAWVFRCARDYGGLHFFTLNEIACESPLILTSEILTTYQGANKLRQEKIFTYDNSAQVKTISTISSEGKEISERKNYPYDIENPSPAVSKLLLNNQISTSLFTENLSGEVHWNKLIDYKEWSSGFVLPEFVKHSSDGSPYFTELSVLSYDNYGNPQEVRYIDGVKVMFIWGYHGSHPIAKIEGELTYQQLNDYFQSLHGVDLSHLVALSNADFDYSTEQILLTWLDTLRNDIETIGNVKVNLATYTFDPLIGMTSIRDFNGALQFYKYNQRGQLILITDSNGDAIKSFEYRFKQQN